MAVDPRIQEEDAIRARARARTAETGAAARVAQPSHRRSQARWRSRFDEGDTDPLLSLANLVDVMLVFACGLMAALVASQAAPWNGASRPVERGEELPQLPQGVGSQGSGFEAVGQVYRDPKSGKLILVGK